ncbi:MAG: hypothetical protein LBJ61_03210 [Deltaproteobacteria bacterium]|nr:hypothetical protein [Deltaproteobacteria bacterium]
MKRATIGIAAAALLTSWACLAQAQSNYVTKLADQASKYMEVRNRHASADDRGTWIPFVDSEKEKARSELDQYLNKALGILLDDNAAKNMNKIRDLYQENRNLQEKISDLSIRKATAPSDKSFYEFWKTTATGYDDQIRADQAKIRANLAAVDRLMDDIAAELSSAKLPISQDQVKSLFILTPGGEQLNSMVVLKNLYAMGDLLKTTIAESKDVNVSKKYYGVFLLATDAHQKQLENALTTINEKYIPKLIEIQKNNRVLMDQTRELARNNPIYQNNLSAQEQTLSVAIKFQELLRHQAQIVFDRLTALQDVIAFAENSYRTVDLAAALSNVMEQSASSLQALLDMPIVPPMLFESDLENKFLEISQQLAAN